jgi:hypothetical protein
MHLPEIACPHCGRKFVNYVFLDQHLLNCAEDRQAQLDREWRKRQGSAEDQLRTAARAIYAKYGPNLAAFFRDAGCEMARKEPRK